MRFGPRKASALIDLNDTTSFANFAFASDDGLGFIDCAEFDRATFQVVPESTSSTAVVEAVYSLDGINPVSFDSNAGDLTVGTGGGVTVNIEGVPLIRLDTKTAEGSALKAKAWVYLENTNIR